MHDRAWLYRTWRCCRTEASRALRRQAWQDQDTHALTKSPGSFRGTRSALRFRTTSVRLATAQPLAKREAVEADAKVPVGTDQALAGEKVIRAAAATPGLGAAAKGRRDGRTMPAELGLDRAKISVGPAGLALNRNVTCAKRRLTPLAGTLRKRGVVKCWISPTPKNWSLNAGPTRVVPTSVEYIKIPNKSPAFAGLPMPP